MIAIRIGPDIPMAIVGSPDYFSRRSAPTSVSQLIDHQAINLYLPTSGTANRWRLIRGGREVRVRMEGQLLLNTIDLIIDAAIDGHGLAYLPYDQVERAIKGKKLIRVLDKFTPDLPGYHLYLSLIHILMLDRTGRHSSICSQPGCPPQSVSAESGTLPPYGKHHR